MSRVDGEACGSEVVGNGHHARNAYGLGSVEDGSHTGRIDGTACVQVGVRVDEVAERLGQWWCGTVFAHADRVGEP